MDLARFMRGDLVFLDVDARNKWDIFKFIVNGMENARLLDDPALFLEEINQRERQSPTCIGRGIALPHSRTSLIDEPVIAFARSCACIPFSPKAADGVDLVFLMGTPKHDPNTYLRILAHLCKLLREKAFREALMSAATADEVLALFKRQGEATVPA